MKREKLDPYWHKSRIAARIWLKAQRGKPLTTRERRLAVLFGNDRGVENRLIQQGIFYHLGSPYRVFQTQSGPLRLLETIGTKDFKDVVGHRN